MNRHFSPRHILLLLLALLIASTAARAAFDPVNDDTDIFLVNPSIDASRPNVLIILDNTANWSRNVGGDAIFINEKTAMVNVINGLDEAFNVGMMMYPETGSGWNNVDGGYLRFGIRQMTTANKTVLSADMNGLSQNGDKGNNNTISLAMMEAYRYFAGKANIAGHGKEKSDIGGNTSNAAVAASLGDHPLPSGATTGTLYDSPIVNGCQKNFIIIISNGGANENASALSDSEDELATLTGVSPPNIIGLSPSGQQSNWADEWAKYMATADVNATLDGTQNVYTYAVEVDPGTTGQDPAMTALMKSVASNGKGKYFAVSSLNGGQSIVNALNQIFQEIQAVNSVFASTTLPVSVNVRGTNLNQVYIGVFRPDSAKAPRWYGNLKCYKLGYESATDDLFLVDAAGNPAENATSGFVNATSPSFWTSASSFWGFRTDDENGPGGASDLPDGDLVEKGGVAQRLRVDYATSQTARKLYTCTDYNTTSGSSDPCGPGDLLSDYLFSTTNTDINASSLLLDSQLVSLLNAEQEQTVSALTDTREVTSLSTASGSVTVSSLLNSTTTVDISAISTSESVNLDTLDNGATSLAVTLQYVANNAKKWALATTASAHGYTNGQTVTISGAASALYNGTWSITWVSATEFKYNVGSNLPAGTDSGSSATSTTNVTATSAAAHGFTAGQDVTISGADPSGFNGTFAITSTPSATTFTFNTPTALAANTTAGSAASRTLTATATSTGHGLSDGDSVTIAGATPADYNGVQTITLLDANRFTYTASDYLADASGTITGTVGGTGALAITASAHGFSSGDLITITGGDPAGYNGTFAITVLSATAFSYDTGVSLPTNVGTSVSAAGGTSTTATAVAAGHRFSTGDTVTISGATPLDYNGDYVITVVDGDTFQYALASAPSAASGTIGVRLTSPTAFATATAHGYTTGDSVDMRSADQSDYNIAGVSVTVLDADTFSYPLATSVGAVATGSPVAVTDSTLVQARVVSHGFASGDSVTIAGADPAAFNGTYTITKVDDDNFTYTIGSPQGVASGTITAALSGAGGGAGGEVSDIISWVRGEDNFEDENANSADTDARASIHGDVLHARPAVVNYNRFGDDNDVYVFYGANDGIFRAVKGGFSSSVGEPEPGTEVWGFVPEEFFSKLRRLRNNEPIISSSNKKPYFADGSIGAYVADDMSKVYLYVSMRRGGRFLYALDVTDPEAPRLLWQRDSGDAGWSELGYTWSMPKVVDEIRAHTNPVVIFGAGYDPDVEDLPPDEITSSSSTSVTAGGTFNRSMGRGIFVVDAFTGDIIWQAGPSAPGGISHHYEEVAGMDYAIPSEVTVISDRSGDSVKNRAYVGDTGGNLWRIDMNAVDVADWEVTQIASIADHSVSSGMRKFLYRPSVVYSSGFDAILIGTGDREHPFDTTVVNRMYMFKDPHTGTSVDSHSVILEGDLYDVTVNCIQTPSACTGGVTSEGAQEALDNADGWYFTLAGGEKVISNAVTLNRVTFFNTNQPGAATDPSDCASDLGVARQYQVYFEDATAVYDRDDDADTDAGDRFGTHPGGGYLPAPVPVVVEIDGEIHEAVISGVRVDEAPGSKLQTRYRKYWYKEID